MPEIVIRVVDKINNSDFYLNTQCTKRGDVIVVAPDGWRWGTEDLTNPDWRILKFPFAVKADQDAAVAELSVFLSPELPTDPFVLSKTLQRRAFKFDIDAASLSPEFKAYIADDSRKEPFFEMVIPLAEVRSLVADVKTLRPSIIDPAVIGGGPSTVIGR